MKDKRELVSPKTGLILLIIFVLFTVVMFAFSALFSSEGFSDAFAAVNESSTTPYVSDEKRFTVIIDAGHGGEDPGAVVGDIREKDLNLILAKKLEGLFSATDYNIILTRKKDVLLYNSGEESQKKQYDLKNRAAIANTYENAVFVSLHMNKFYLESCKGAQVFYSDLPLSMSLAESIQSSVRILQNDNNRQPKNGTGNIFLLERVKCPAVLVECGFISNREDAVNLSSDEYTDKLASLLYKGIIEWIGENETDLCLR